MRLAERIGAALHLPSQGPKVARIPHDETRGEPADDVVEQPGADQLESRFARARRSLRVNHVIAFLDLRDELMHKFGRILKVCVYRDDDIAGREVQPGRERILVAAIAGEVNHLHAFVVGRELVEQVIRAVSAAVVHEQEFEAVRRQRVWNRAQPAIHLRERLLLVVARYDVCDRLHCSPTPCDSCPLALAVWPMPCTISSRPRRYSTQTGS